MLLSLNGLGAVHVCDAVMGWSTIFLLLPLLRLVWGIATFFSPRFVPGRIPPSVMHLLVFFRRGFEMWSVANHAYN